MTTDALAHETLALRSLYALGPHDVVSLHTGAGRALAIEASRILP